MDCKDSLAPRDHLDSRERRVKQAVADHQEPVSLAHEGRTAAQVATAKLGPKATRDRKANVDLQVTSPSVAEAFQDLSISFSQCERRHRRQHGGDRRATRTDWTEG